MTDNGSAFKQVDRTGASARRSGRRRLMVVALALLVLLAIALARRGPNVHSPATARRGTKIHVTAGDLRLGDYALTLYGRDPSGASRLCQARIAGAHFPLSAIDFTARLPLRLPCYSDAGTPAGFTAVTPGRYALIISVPQGTGFNPRLSYISRPLRIT
jgi:hypothetical protein